MPRLETAVNNLVFAGIAIFFLVAVWAWIFSPLDDTYVALGGGIALVVFGIIDAKFFGVLAMFGAILVMALVPWLDTSRVRSGRFRPQFKWWFWLLAVDFVVLTWGGAQPAEGIYPYISLVGAAYWFAYFLVILPLLGVMERPSPIPNTIEEDWNAHYERLTTPAE